MVKNLIRTGVLACGVAALSAVSADDAEARVIDLAFIMDESGSIPGGSYTDAMDSLADALDASIPVGGADTYTITVISFATSATVDVPTTTINTAADLSSVTASIRSQTQAGGTTCYACAFDALGTSTGDFGIINMMTDGFANVRTLDTAASRNNMIARDWDALSFEAIGLSPVGETLLRFLAFDTNSTTDTQPLFNDPSQIDNPLTDAFVLTVSDFGTAYDQAISAKVQRIVDPNPIPLPAALPLILAGLGALGALRLRGRKSA